MHDETYRILKRAVEMVRAQAADMTASHSFPTAMSLAEAERMLAAHEATAKPLPSRWATIHVMGHERFTGEIEAITGGYRVRHLDPDSNELASPFTMLTRDIYAIHSIDWLSQERFEAHMVDTMRYRARRAEDEHRRTTWPEGYQHAVATHPDRVQRMVRHAFVHTATGLVAGFYEAKTEAQEAAWRHVDNDLSDAEHLDLSDPTNAVASTEEAFAVVTEADERIPF